jgi:SAM-dependent methyltransferase
MKHEATGWGRWSQFAGALPTKVMRAVASLPGTDPLDNVAYNRDLWNGYARRSRPDPKVRVRQAECPDATAEQLSLLGSEWGTPDAVDEVVRRFIDPYINPDAIVGEIGTGGGRVAALVAPNSKRFHCFDISEGMLELARQALADCPNVDYVLLAKPSLPAKLAETFDFLYSFDVFVHLDLHTIWKYLREIERSLSPGGHAFIHTANLTAPAGWERFRTQDRYYPESFYFVSPEIVRTLVSHTALRIVEESQPDRDNFYLNRDYLVVLQKPV